MTRVLVIDRDTLEATAWAARLRALGFDAAPYLSLGAKGFRGIRQDPPHAILIDLTRLPSYGKAMGVLLRQQKSLGAIPLVFVEGDPDKAAQVRAVLPDAVYTTWAKAPSAIRRAIRQAPREAMPPRDPHNVRVEFEVRDPYFRYIWTGGSYAKINAAGFLNQRQLEVTRATNGYAICVTQPVYEKTIDEMKQLVAGETNQWQLSEDVFDEKSNLVFGAYTMLDQSICSASRN